VLEEHITLYKDILPRSTSENRVIGYVVSSPPFGVGIGRYTEDFAIEMGTIFRVTPSTSGP